MNDFPIQQTVTNELNFSITDMGGIAYARSSSQLVRLWRYQFTTAYQSCDSRGDNENLRVG